MNTKGKIELPLVEPIYSTYHYQGPGSAIIENNPSIRNWYLNQIINLSCTKKFLSGFTTPELGVSGSHWSDNPYLEKTWYPMRFLDGHIHYVIHKLLDAGYYIYFCGIDDYYVEGKSWYHEKHVDHDGCICGYDPENKSYCIYAYDQNWIYRKFWASQKSFENGRKSLFRQEKYGKICALKAKNEQVHFSSETALNKIASYLDSSLDKYPEATPEKAYGLVVHDYIAKYIAKLYDGSVPYDRMDRRIFRLIWEQKKSMLERIQHIENELSLDNSLSEAYKMVIREADNCRMLYAAHHMKQRNHVLPIIQNKLLFLKDMEKNLLEDLLKNSQGIDRGEHQ